MKKLILFLTGLPFFVVLIGGILAALLLPAYQDYVIRAQVTSALAEISPAKVNMEVAITERKIPTFNNTFRGDRYIYLGIGNGADINSDTTQTDYCLVEKVLQRDFVAISCEIGRGTANVNESVYGKVVVLARDTQTGEWGCFSDVAAKYRPTMCQALPG